MKGRRIITGTVTHNECTLYLRDSYNMIPLPLSSFKKAFGLSGVSGKGEFPFLLLEEKWYHSSFKGLPPLKYYNVGAKSPDSKSEFMRWYNSHDPESYVFNFDDELHNYCKQDVILLLLGLIEFRRAILQLSSWDPYVHVCTLASLTSHILRCDHIKPRTLVNIPDNGYTFNRQQSDSAIKWIKWQMHVTGEHILHAQNGGEKRILLPQITTHVDGFTESNKEGKSVIYEYNGCFWHGHKTHFKSTDFNTLCQQSFGTLYAATMDRLKKLSEVYEVVSVWECEVNKELTRNAEMRTFFNQCQVCSNYTKKNLIIFS